MFRNLVYLIIFLTIGLFISCINEPELPIEPSINLKSFTFKEIPDSFQDSIIIEIDFKDGDGDLGLTDFDTLPPYHEMDSIPKVGGGFVKLIDATSPEYDTLPPYDPNILCRYWETVIPADSNSIFYVNRNPHHFNFHCDILVKQNNGKFVPYDFLEERCSPGLNGRFFVLNTTGKERPLEGVLRFGSRLGFKLLFPTQTLKLRIYIEDRRLNRSNVVESEEFPLSRFLTI